MNQALQLATRGKGCVEPNPMVGCVIVRDGVIIGEGFHAKYGGPHAEVHAIQNANVTDLRGCSVYVTLEPCAHHGKTPPCAERLATLRPDRVIVAMEDPCELVRGKGIARLLEANIQVSVGICGAEAEKLNAPYLTLQSRHRPYIIGKWAMTTDGKLATRCGESFWISGPESRKVVHQLRSQVDGIIVGSGTVMADDPLLTPRDGGSNKIPLRVVVDSQLQTDPNRQLARSAADFPTLIWTSQQADPNRVQALQKLGCEVYKSPVLSHQARLQALLTELGRRRCTNLLCEGGAGLLGALFDAQCIDEVHVFIAPKLFGGGEALTPLGGQGVSLPSEAAKIKDWNVNRSGEDIYLSGSVSYL